MPSRAYTEGMRALALSFALLAATPAAAWDWDFGHHSSSSGAPCDVGCGVFFGLTFGLDLAIDIVDVVVLANHDFISPGWSVVQALWGVGHVIFGAVASGLGGLGVALQVKDAGTVLGLGLLTLGEGIFLVVVAIVSTVRFFQHRREQRLHPAVPVVSLSLEPRGGATAVLGWRF